MISKLSIVVIYSIVAASCVIIAVLAPKTDEEVVQVSFDDCLKWANNGKDPAPDHILTVGMLISYFGDRSDNDLGIVEDCFAADPTTSIDKKKYGEILKSFCQRQYPNLTLERCAEKKKSAAISTSLEELKSSYIRDIVCDAFETQK
ncbi:uncharacterized protein LOC126835975 [Adelges cooleyi]|uniref:uncharacterized protein LOC126835975 n=1 Tax=Adelges cooleyi TaxID=133065 RepID=UPI00217FE5B5|nr:uncharacterized protein LOC126835975 [Adelges cooleyi]